jgi:transposase InsO family protein
MALMTAPAEIQHAREVEPTLTGSDVVLGWSMDEHMATALVADALTMAVEQCGDDVRGVIFHSDRGSATIP